MTIRKCYELLEGDFEEVVSRMHKEERIERYLLKFPKDDSFAMLKKYLAEENIEEAFRAAHTLKGVAINLGLGRLSRSSIEITELLRRGQVDEAKVYFSEVEADYMHTLSVIKTYMDGK